MARDDIAVGLVAPDRRGCGVAVYTENLLEGLRPLVDVRYVVEARAFRPDLAADIVHVQHEYFLFGGVAPWKSTFRRFARRVARPAVLTAHEFVAPVGSPAFRAAVSVTNRWTFRDRRFRRIIVHTEADRDRMAAAGIERDRLTVIRHGVPRAPALPPREEARRDMGLEGRFVLSILGFLSRRKGHSLALQALALLPPDVTLLMAGGRHPDDATGYVDALERERERLRLGDSVRVTGFLSDEELARAVAASDMILCPFTESSGSGSLALALACGQTIVASDIAAHREIERDTPGALTLFHAGDPLALARAVSQLRCDPPRAETAREQATAYAAKHSYEQMARETVRVYASVLERGIGHGGARDR